MFDTMTMTKIVGGFCGAFLVYLLVNWGGESLYHVGAEEGGEGEVSQAYVIEAGEAEGGAEAAGDAPVDIAPLLASADAAAGEKVFAKCKSCHKLDGSKGTGPALNGVIGRDIASADFTYTAALTDLPGNWEPQEFSEFLTNPPGYAPGTKMAIKLPKPEDRANLIAFLETHP